MLLPPLLLLLLVVLGLASVTAGQQIPTFPTSFTANIEGNFAQDNASLELREYFDYEGDRQRVDIRVRDHLTISLHDYPNERHYSVVNGLCTVTNATVDRLPDTSLNSTTGKPQLFTPGDIFADSPNMNFTFAGQALVRGITCDTWTAPVTWDGVNSGPFAANLTVTWSFTSQAWRAPADQGEAVPVRLHVTGVADRTGGVHELDNTYEFVDFYSGRPDEERFTELSTLYVCPDYVQKDVPNLNNDYRGTVVVNDVLAGWSYTVNEYYDYTNNRARIRSEGVRDIIILPSNNTMYTVNLTSGDCAVHSPIPEGLGWGLVNSTSHHLNRLRTHFTYANGTTAPTVYVGVSEARGMPVDRFHTFFYGNDSRGNFVSIADDTFYLTDPSWHYQGAAGVAVPVRGEFKGTYVAGDSKDEVAIHHVNTWTATEYGPIEDSHFVIPDGCPGNVNDAAGGETTFDGATVVKTGDMNPGIQALIIIVVLIVMTLAGWFLAPYCCCKRANRDGHVEFRETSMDTAMI